MAAISTNFPRTFYKLSETWNKKVGTRNSKDKIFINTTQKDPVSYVPYVFSAAMNRVEDLICSLKALVPAAHTSEIGLWIYDMRASDAMPRTTADTERLYAFVRKLIQSDWFDTATGMYLEKNIHISVSFFVWWFSTRDFFFATKEIRQTTYYGIRRVWTPVLLRKVPVVEEAVVALPTPLKKDKRSPVVSTKDVAKCQEFQERILALIQGEHSTFTIEWKDDRNVHLKISGCLEFDNDFYVAGKKGKKLQKMYQDYSKLKKKDGVSKALVMATTSEEPTQVAAEEPEPVVCAGCLTHQPNQLAHMGPNGCCGDEFEDDEIPESWEDL